MAWPSLAASDTLSGAGAKTVCDGFYDRTQAAAHRSTTWYFAEVDMTLSLATKDTQRVRVPAWCLSGAVLTLRVRTRTTSAGSATFQLNETDTATAGTPQVIALNANWTYEDVPLTVPDDTWAGTLKTFEIKGQRPAAGADTDWPMSGEFVAGNFVLGSV